MQDVYKTFDEYNPEIKQKILIVFDDMNADVISNKKFRPTVIGLFIRGTVYQTIYHTSKYKEMLD